MHDLLSIPFHNLSDGQKRFILIARALVFNPKILILDEPTSMLDFNHKFKLIKIITNLYKSGTTVIHTTHSIDTVNNLTSRVILAKNGEIVRDGVPSEILNSENLSRLFNHKLNVTSQDGYWQVYPK